MGISVNHVDITDEAIQLELPHHQHTGNPLKQSVEELILRTVLLQEANRLEITAGDDDTRIETLFAQQIRVPEVDAGVCNTFYSNQLQRFTNGELVEARHILFQVTPSVSLELLRQTAELVLAELHLNPERFPELAKEYSNCSSGALGGNLGQLTRGQTVPEFEVLVFRLKEGELASRLLESRFGLHIVQVLRRTEGTCLSFEAVKTQIADKLTRRFWRRAVHQYLQILVGRADIQGVTLDGAESMLVQ